MGRGCFAVLTGSGVLWPLCASLGNELVCGGRVNHAKAQEPFEKRIRQLRLCIEQCARLAWLLHHV